MVKYFQRTERHYDRTASTEVHGFEGPIHTTAGARAFPLGKELLAAFERCGVPFNLEPVPIETEVRRPSKKLGWSLFQPL